MHRRTILTIGVFGLTGCVAQPSPTEEIVSPPNFFASFVPTDDGYTVTFEDGTPLTEQNSARIFVNVRGPDESTERTWASNDDPDAETTFPLEPGATIDVPTPAQSTIHVIWLAPSESRSSKLDSFNPDSDDDNSTNSRDEKAEAQT